MSIAAFSLPSHRIPVVAAVGFGLGARLGVDDPSRGLPAMLACLLAGVVLGLFRARRPRGGLGTRLWLAAVLGMSLAAGVAWGAWRQEGGPGDALAGLDGRTLLLRGAVCRPEGSSARSCRLFVRVTWAAVQSRGGWEGIDPGEGLVVLVRVPSPRSGGGAGGAAGRGPWPPPARWGDGVVVLGALRDPSSGPRALPSYAAWLALQDVRHVVDTRGAADVAVVRSPPGSAATTVAIGVRRALQATIDAALPGDEAALLKGVVLAEGNALPEDLAAPFRATGTWHVMVTAGLHVNVATALFASLLAWCGCSGRRAALLSLPLVALYAMAVGGSPSVTRAAIMSSVSLVGHACGRRGDSLASLGLAVLLLVAWDPRVTLHPGFHMSVACVVGLSTLGRGLRARAGFLPHGVRELGVATVATQLAVAPLAAACFGTVSLSAVLANLVVVPLCEVALGFGLLVAVGGALLSLGPAGALPGLRDGLLGALGLPLLAWLKLIESTVAGLGLVPGSDLAAEAPGMGFTLIYWASLGALTFLLESRARPGEAERHLARRDRAAERGQRRAPTGSTLPRSEGSC